MTGWKWRYADDPASEWNNYDLPATWEHIAWEAKAVAETAVEQLCSEDPGFYRIAEEGIKIEVQPPTGRAYTFVVIVEFDPVFSAYEEKQEEGAE